VSDVAQYLWNALVDPVPDQAVKRSGELGWNRTGDSAALGYGDLIRKPAGRKMKVVVNGQVYELPENEEMFTPGPPPMTAPDPLKGKPTYSGTLDLRNFNRR
jgi:hypothetical protein